jgi:hypothetical protein
MEKSKREEERKKQAFMVVKMSILFFLVVTQSGLVGNYCLQGMYHPEDGGDVSLKQW